MDEGIFLQAVEDATGMRESETRLDEAFNRVIGMLQQNKSEISIACAKRAAEIFNGAHGLRPSRMISGICIYSWDWVMRCGFSGLLVETHAEHDAYLKVRCGKSGRRKIDPVDALPLRWYPQSASVPLDEQEHQALSPQSQQGAHPRQPARWWQIYRRDWWVTEDPYQG
jgi:hypothetical protein